MEYLMSRAGLVVILYYVINPDLEPIVLNTGIGWFLFGDPIVRLGLEYLENKK